MIDAAFGVPLRDPGHDTLRLRTLILLRWMAIGGQLAAIGIATARYGLELPLAPTLVAVALSAAANLAFALWFAPSRRLSGAEAAATLSFDLVQLSVLLFLTGGLNNPFAILIIAPVIISASALPLRMTILLGGLALVLITLIMANHLPLRFSDGHLLEVPALFEFGFWLSIVTGILFLGLYAYRVASEIRVMSDALLATQMALAREQKLTDLGGVVAAAAHELGTPLATIKLTSAELMQDLADRPEQAEDARLIRDQADRCRDILRSMGRAGKEDLHLQSAPFETLLREAAEPHAGRGRDLHFSFAPATGCTLPQPTVRRRAEILHGLRNLIQNAVDFAQARVFIHVEWSHELLKLQIEDDGPGFPAHLLGRIGDPFLRPQGPAAETTGRPAYEGMGLGMFIAKTLLERSGALLEFSNGEGGGARVRVQWPASILSAPRNRPLGENRLHLP